MPNPTASRPEPSAYFLPADEGLGLLDWQTAVEKIVAAENYWVATVRPDGRPHSMPVWGVWLDGVFYFSTSPQSRKARNIAKNPAVVVNLESGVEAVVFEGKAELVSDDESLLAFRDAYNPKYEWNFTLEQLQESGIFAVRPTVAFGWLGNSEDKFMGSGTRWTFDEE